MKINNDWFFEKGTSPKELVQIPHSVEITPENSSACINYQGDYAYKKEIYVPEDASEQKILLTFHGIMGTSKLYINQKFIAQHFCSYTPFVSEISDHVLFGQNNLIEIKANNEDDPSIPIGKPQKDLDFSYEGGMYRDVTLEYTAKLYITQEILANKVASGGLFFYTTESSSKESTSFVQIHLMNESEKAEKFTLQSVLKYKDEEIHTVEEHHLLDGNTDGTFTHKFILENPHLWEPSEPHLYSLTVTVTSDLGEHKRELEVGIRTFEFTAENGVLFNGKSYRLSGGNYHQTFPYVGNAMSNNLQKRDIAKLNQIETRSLRGHYPFSDTFTKECDRTGIPLIVSNPGWQFFNDTEHFKEVSYQNMRDIIRWKRNHPAVILWAHILNDTVLPSEFVQTLYNIVHEELPFTTCYCAADYGLADLHYKGYDPGMLSPETTVYGDDSGITSNLHWVREYGDTPDNYFDQNCAWRSPRWFGDGAMVKSIQRMLGLDNQNIYENYIDVVNQKKICGYGIWPLMEHNRGYHINPCFGGHWDLFRLPKFSYYFMKSQITPKTPEDTVLFIANWASDISPNDVMILSNCQSVRLYFDDVLVGEQTADNISVKYPPFTFHNIIQPHRSRNRFTLKAEGIFQGEVVQSATITTAGTADHLVLEADLEGIPPVADGSDLFVVHCKVVDKDGTIVPQTADRTPILFEVTGEGTLVGGLENGANPLCPNAGIASILIRTSKKSGDVKITANYLHGNPKANCFVKGGSLTVTTLTEES